MRIRLLYIKGVRFRIHEKSGTISLKKIIANTVCGVLIETFSEEHLVFEEDENGSFSD